MIDGNSYNSSLIILDHVTNVTIKNLNINGSYAARTKFHEVAMYLDSSSNNKILNCYFTGDSLSLQDSHKNTIIGNIDLRLHMVDSDSNIIANNSLAGTIATESIELRNAANNLILRNNGTKISLVWSTNNLIFGNRITGPNWSWLFISDGSSQNMFVANEVVGPFIIESSIQSGDNLFYHNNFMKAWTAKYHITDYDPNLVDNIEVTIQWNTTNEGNYWSDYVGQDLNHNGIGDTPYIINAFNQDNYPLINPVNIEKEPQPQLTP